MRIEVRRAERGTEIARAGALVATVTWRHWIFWERSDYYVGDTSGGTGWYHWPSGAHAGSWLGTRIVAAARAAKWRGELDRDAPR